MFRAGQTAVLMGLFVLSMKWEPTTTQDNLLNLGIHQKTLPQVIFTSPSVRLIPIQLDLSRLLQYHFNSYKLIQATFKGTKELLQRIQVTNDSGYNQQSLTEKEDTCNQGGSRKHCNFFKREMTIRQIMRLTEGKRNSLSIGITDNVRRFQYLIQNYEQLQSTTQQTLRYVKWTPKPRPNGTYQFQEKELSEVGVILEALTSTAATIPASLQDENIQLARIYTNYRLPIKLVEIQTFETIGTDILSKIRSILVLFSELLMNAIGGNMDPAVIHTAELNNITELFSQAYPEQIFPWTNSSPPDLSFLYKTITLHITEITGNQSQWLYLQTQSFSEHQVIRRTAVTTTPFEFTRSSPTFKIITHDGDEEIELLTYRNQPYQIQELRQTTVVNGLTFLTDETVKKLERMTGNAECLQAIMNRDGSKALQSCEIRMINNPEITYYKFNDNTIYYNAPHPRQIRIHCVEIANFSITQTLRQMGALKYEPDCHLKEITRKRINLNCSDLLTRNQDSLDNSPEEQCQSKVTTDTITNFGVQSIPIQTWRKLLTSSSPKQRKQVREWLNAELKRLKLNPTLAGLGNSTETSTERVKESEELPSVLIQNLMSELGASREYEAHLWNTHSTFLLVLTTTIGVTAFCVTTVLYVAYANSRKKRRNQNKKRNVIELTAILAEEGPSEATIESYVNPPTQADQ